MRIIKSLLITGLVALLMWGGSQPSATIPKLSSLHQTMLTASSSGSACYKFNAEDKGFASKMNAERSKKGKGGMKLDLELGKVAIKHTDEMIKKNSLHHTDSNQLASRVTKWSTVGENVGVGGSVDSLHEAFMASPTHKENILFTKYKYVGVGTKVKDGTMWVTVIFESEANPGSPLC